MIHLQSIIFMTALIQIFLAGILFVVWRLYKDIAGIRNWLWMFILYTVGFFLFLGRPVLPLFLTIIAAHWFVFMAAYQNVLAINTFVNGKPLRHWKQFVALSIYSAILSYFIYIKPNFQVRVVLFCIYYSWLFFWAALIIMRHSTRQLPSRYIFSGICIFNALFHVARGLTNLTTAHEHTLMAGANITSKVIFLETLVISVLFVIGIILLIAEDRTNHLKKISEFDQLTKIFNRHAFMILYEKAVKKMKRDKKPLSIMMVDLDYFKHVNDTYGHATGDAALVHFVNLASSVLRDEDILGRIGGEEFAVFLPEISGTSAAAIAERVRMACETTPLKDNGNTVRITISTGVAEMFENEDCLSLMRRADDALYKAKAKGRNMVVLASESVFQVA